jgi:type I restriction enzyme S subunit
MTAAQKLITENVDIWSSAIKAKSTAGRGTSNKMELYGIKKLRELILELAVRGLLVQQDPNDEPASELLKRIEIEKATLIKSGKVKRQEKLPGIGEAEKIYELPDRWEWARLGNLSSDIHYGYTASAQPAHSGFRLLRITDIQNDRVNWETVPGCEISPDRAEGYLLEDNDILIARTGGTIGKSYLVENLDVKAVFASYLIRVKRISAMYSPYLKTYLRSAVYWSQLYENASGTGQPNVNATALKQLLVPIPTLESQHRIVAKVDELMALCDQLEQQQTDSISAHQTLVQTLLGALTNASERGEFEFAWTRVAQHFDTLLTTEHSIDQLKQTILQLAVMGKLVSQNPNDEPASQLLKRIAAEKSRLIKENEVKKDKPLPDISENEKPFKAPNSWEFARLGSITTRIGSGSTPRGGASAYVESGIPFFRSQNVWNDGLKLDDIAYITEDTHQRMNNTQVFPGDVLLNITGASLGRSTIFPSELKTANVSQHVTIIRLVEASMGPFVHLGILSPLVQSLVWSRQVGMAIEGLSKKVLEMFEFPIPPIEEQYRIVEKVDQLFKILDKLKIGISTSKELQVQLADRLLSNVTGAEIGVKEKMKVPENELVTKLKIRVSPNDNDVAPLSAILTQNDGELSAKKLWELSGMDVDSFYQQLKLEMEPGWIVEPKKAEMREKS